MRNASLHVHNLQKQEQTINDELEDDIAQWNVSMKDFEAQKPKEIPHSLVSRGSRSNTLQNKYYSVS